MTFQAASEEVEALYRPRALTAAAAFEFTGGLQFWRVPISGVYRITARGAKAADGACRWRSLPDCLSVGYPPNQSFSENSSLVGTWSPWSCVWLGCWMK